MTTRAKRGVENQSLPGGFTKDILYFKGRMLVENFLKEGKLEDLYYGKYSAYDVPIVKKIQGLKKPKFVPKL